MLKQLNTVSTRQNINVFCIIKYATHAGPEVLCEMWYITIITECIDFSTMPCACGPVEPFFKHLINMLVIVYIFMKWQVPSAGDTFLSRVGVKLNPGPVSITVTLYCFYSTDHQIQSLISHAHWCSFLLPMSIEEVSCRHGVSRVVCRPGATVEKVVGSLIFMIVCIKTKQLELNEPVC